MAVCLKEEKDQARSVCKTIVQLGSWCQGHSMVKVMFSENALPKGICILNMNCMLSMAKKLQARSRK